MKCKVCGADSGKYPLCRICNIKKAKGEIIKCSQCGNWHYVNSGCTATIPKADGSKYLYNVKSTLISKSEQSFYAAIKSAVPEGFCVFPQINLASFIDRTDDARYHNELFRNVDFLITDAAYCPKIIVEINDQTHMNSDRKERDEKVQKICEEAGIPILKLWTSYGVNTTYIKGRIDETLSKLPIERIHHFNQVQQQPAIPPAPTPSAPMNTYSSTSTQTYSRGGCYVATCIYGSYDCPPVWILRRYRDNILAKSWLGKVFIHTYYTVSPVLVRWFGNTGWFQHMWRPILNKLVDRLRAKGIKDTPYNDCDL